MAVSKPGKSGARFKAGKRDRSVSTRVTQSLNIGDRMPVIAVFSAAMAPRDDSSLSGPIFPRSARRY